jgi:hypothetical protein
VQEVHGVMALPLAQLDGTEAAGHGEQSGNRQWRAEQSSGASEFEATGEMALLLIEVVTK